MESWTPYLISSLVGLLVGIERERAHREKKAMGVRTFLLLALLGATAGGMTETWLATLIAAFSFCLILLGYFFTGGKGHDHGLTTEFAGAIIFTVGYISHQNPVLAAVVGPVVALVLFSKRSLHKFTAALKPAELQAAILILLLAVTVVNFLGTEPVDPWGIFVPHKFGMLILMLAGLEFAGYVLTKILGERNGTLITGFLGGFVSSTAVLLSTARQAGKTSGSCRPLVGSALAAKLAAFVEVLLIVSMTSPSLLTTLIVPLGLGLGVGVLVLFATGLNSERTPHALTLRSPLDVRGVLRLAVLLALILGAVAFVEDITNGRATWMLSFVTGLFELHGITLATATLVAQQKLSLAQATLSVILALAASLIAKIAIAWMVNRGRFARDITLSFTAMGAAVAFGYWLTN